MALSDLLETLPLILADFPNISLVYLFGSQVTGQTGPMSDYDLAIFNESDEDDYLTQAEFQHAVIKTVNTDHVDVVLLKRAPVELAYQIISIGKLLYQKDMYTRVEYEARVLGEYGDYLPILQSYQDQILRGGKHAQRVQRYREALGRTRRALGAARTSPRSETR